MIKVNGREIEFGNFPNNETNMTRDSFKNILKQGLNNQVIFKYTEDADLIKLMFVKEYIDTSHVKSDLTILYMPYSRMDRSENASPFTLKYISNFINRLKFENVYVVEPHSDVTCALLNNSYAKYINFDLIEKVKEEVDFDEDEDYIVFPDTGASKRYQDMFEKNILIGHKHRNFRTGIIESLEIIGNVTGGKKAIIVDDLSSKGGTFVYTAKELKKLGIEEVYLLVAHAENSIFKGEFRNNQQDVNEEYKTMFGFIDKVFTTNSHVTEQDNWENKKFAPQLKIYDIETILEDDIYG